VLGAGGGVWLWWLVCLVGGGVLVGFCFGGLGDQNPRVFVVFFFFVGWGLCGFGVGLGSVCWSGFVAVGGGVVGWGGLWGGGVLFGFLVFFVFFFFFFLVWFFCVFFGLGGWWSSPS